MLLGAGSWSGRERPGGSPNCQDDGCSPGTQSTLLCSPVGRVVGISFPNEVGVGKRLGSPDLICSVGGTGFLAGAAQPCLHSSHPWYRVEKAGLPPALMTVLVYLALHCPEHQLWPCSR